MISMLKWVYEGITTSSKVLLWRVQWWLIDEEREISIFTGAGHAALPLGPVGLTVELHQGAHSDLSSMLSNLSCGWMAVPMRAGKSCCGGYNEFLDEESERKYIYWGWSCSSASLTRGSHGVAAPGSTCWPHSVLSNLSCGWMAGTMRDISKLGVMLNICPMGCTTGEGKEVQ